MTAENKDWVYCFYCGTYKPSSRKRKPFARAICNACVEVRRPKKQGENRA